MEKYLIKTSYPCLIKTKSDMAEIDENDLLELQDEDIIFIYPTNNLYVPFYINLNCPKENERFSIIKKDDKNIIYIENCPSVKLSQKESLNFSGKTCDITISGNIICFETDSKKVSYNCPHDCRNYKIFKIKKFACIQFEHNLYAYSIEKNRLTHFNGDSLDVNQNNIIIQKKFHDSLNREKNAEYQIDDEIKVEKESFMHNPINFNETKLVPFRLLESIKAKDYESALDFLSEKLKGEIDSDQIKDFFGEISNFLPVNTNEFITISNFNKNYVKFVLVNNKIDDILIDNL